MAIGTWVIDAPIGHGIRLRVNYLGMLNICVILDTFTEGFNLELLLSSGLFSTVLITPHLS